MTRGRLVWILLVGFLPGRWSPIGAQPVPAQNGPMGADLPAVYLNDSFEANDAIRRARRLQASGRWEDAARAYRRIATDFAGKLVRTDEGVYVNVTEFVNRSLATWPQSGIDAYRSLFEQDARSAYEAAAGRRDLRRVLAVYESYFCTEAAARAADLAAQIALEAGNFDLAVRTYENLLERHPTVTASPEDITTKLAVAYLWSGRSDDARALLEPMLKERPEYRLRWMGRDVSPAVLLEGPPLVAVEKSAGSDDFVWPVFSGAMNGNRQPDSTVQPGAPLWSFTQFEPTSLAAVRQKKSDDSLQAARAQGRFVVFQPIIANGMVYFHDARHAWALNAISGNLIWEYEFPDAAGIETRGSADAAPPNLYTATVADGRLYLRAGNQTPSPYSSRVSYPQTLLVCLDALTGQMIWQVDRSRLDEKLQDVHLDGSPLVHQGQLYVTARKTKPFGFEDCYQLQFDAQTGQPGWQTHLASASTGGGGYPHPTRTFAAVSGDTVYVHTNLGAIAALASHNGQVRWLRIYPRTRRNRSRTFSRRRAASIQPWHYNPTLCFDDRLLVAPLDSDDVLVLRQSDGEILRRIPKEDKLHDLKTILGILDGKLYGVGTHVFAYDLDADEMLWDKRLEKISPFGRGFLTRQRVYLSVVETPDMASIEGALLTYDLGGDLLHEKKWDPLREGGNLLVTPDQVIVAGDNHISAYASKEEVFARLGKQIQAAPDDPAPLLDLAEVAFRVLDYDQAQEAFERAVEVAGGYIELADPKLKRRVYHDAMLFASHFRRMDPPQIDRAIAMYLHAAQCPPEPRAYIEYRLALADALQLRQRPGEAIAYYQQILLDPALRTLPADEADETTAGQFSEKQINELIQVHGIEIYERFESEARTAFLLARDGESLEALASVAERYPNARVAAEALLTRAGLLRAQGRGRLGARAYHHALTRYGDHVDAPKLYRQIAECYRDAGKMESAAAWLRKASRQFPDARIEVEGQRLTFESYRKILLGGEPHDKSSLPVMRPVRPAPAYSRKFSANIHLIRPPLGTDYADWDTILVYYAGRIEAYVASENKPRWPEAVTCPMTPVLIGYRPKLAIFSTKHQVFAVGRETGRVVWRYGKYPADLNKPDTDPETFHAWTAHTLYGDRLVSLQDIGFLTCLDPDTGRQLWQVEPEHKPTEPMVVTEELILYRSTRQNEATFPVLDVDTGQLLQAVRPKIGNSGVTMAVSPDGVLLLASGSQIFAYDPYTGEPLWTRKTSSKVRPESLEIGLDGFYLAETGRTIVKRSTINGQTLWTSEEYPGRRADRVQTQLLDDQLYVASNHGVVSLDPETGEELWRGLDEGNPNLKYQFLSEPYYVAVDEQESRAQPGQPTGKILTASFFDRRNASGRLAKNGRQVLRGIERPEAVLSLNNTLIVLDGRRGYHAFMPGPESAR